MPPEQHILKNLSARFPDRHFDASRLTLVNKGLFANAIVFRYKDDALNLTIKDFTHCPLPVRVTLGRFFANREYTSLMRLNGLPGMVSNVIRLSPLAVAYDFIEGDSLTHLESIGKKFPPAFFSEMEKRIAGMHARGLVHLDLRNMGNVLAGNDGMPHFIDFQSAISLKFVPPFLRKLLKDTDNSAVCKAWKRLCSEPLPEEKRRFLEAFNGKRRFWILKGYPGKHLARKLFSKKTSR